MDNVWYYAEGNKSVGPVSLADLTAILSRVSNAKDVLVWREGLSNWEKAQNVRELVSVVVRPPPINLPTSHSGANVGKSQKSTEPLLAVDSAHVRKITNPQYLIYKAKIANSILILYLTIFLSPMLSQAYLIDQLRSLVIQYGYGHVPMQLIPTWIDFIDTAVQITSVCWYFILLACIMYCFSLASG